jgi:hypothetical protein
MNYYQFATTGGGSALRGVDYNEFDHIVWVTMKNDGPLITNILLDSILPENLKVTPTGEKGVSTAKRLATHPISGFVYFQGSPIPGAVVTFTSDKGDKAKAVKATGIVEPDGSFRLTTYKAFDGAPAGSYKVTVSAGKSGATDLPAMYGALAKTPLSAEIKAGKNEIKLELKK